MHCDQVKKAYRGVCKECKCPGIVSPVCADDGHTYVNSCEATCHKALVIYDGRCKDINIEEGEGKKMCHCPKVYDPVCGRSGKTY